MNADDRKLMQAIFEAMEHLHRTGDTQVFDLYAAPELITALRERLVQPEHHDPIGDAQDKLIAEQASKPQMQPCSGRNCGSTNPNLHSAECFEDYEKSTGMAQPVSPKCGAIIEVFGKEWRLEYMSLPVGKHKLYPQQYTYTTPSQRTWVGLTDEEVMEIAFNFDVPSLVVKTVEAKLKEKNT